MSFNTDDTICAVSTAPGGAARGMVRVSGDEAVTIAATLFSAANDLSIESLRWATAIPGSVNIQVHDGLRTLPCDLYAWPTQQSYTREPTVEFHTLGSAALLASLVKSVCDAGARLAEPGEFTLRAFLAGRLDLTQAEAVLGVIDARGSEDLETSLSQLAGGLARPLHGLREDLLQLLAELEAGLDFVEEDIEFISSTEIRERLESARQLLNNVSLQMASRNISQSRVQIALIGLPNAGKSSLFNAIVERNGCRSHHPFDTSARALVSPQRGTTRDYLTATISLGGFECELVDTAGVELVRSDLSAGDALDSCSPKSEIDYASQLRTDEQRKQAPIRVYCVDAREIYDEATRSECNDHFAASGDTILVFTKADALTAGELPFDSTNASPALLTSSRTGQGLDALFAVLGSLASDDKSALRGEVVSATATRCRESVRLAETSIAQAAELVMHRVGNELVAVELRAALEELGSVVGAIYTNDLLDRIFGTFCIGK